MQESNTPFMRSKVALWFSIIVLTAYIALVSVLANPHDAEAASWRNNGSELTNGKVSIYYTTKTDSYGIPSSYTIYKRDAPGKVGKKLFSTKVSMMNNLSLCGYYNGNVFYSVGMSSALPRTLKVYKSSTKKIKTISGARANFQMSGKYLIAMSDPANVAQARKLYSINMSTCKAKKITSSSFGYTIRKGKLYFLKGTSFKKSNYSYLLGVYRSKVTGKSQKRVTKTVRGDYATIGKNNASIRTSSNNYVSVKF